MSNSRKFLILLLAIFGVSCSDRVEVFLDSGDFSAMATINSAKVEKIDDKPVIFVRGNLLVTGKVISISTIDLTCFGMKAGNQSDAGVYVDRIAHVLPEKIAARDGRVTIDVYWVFENQEIDNFSIDDLSLFLRIKDGSCVALAT